MAGAQDDESAGPLGALYEKVVSETAMLLQCVASVPGLVADVRLRVADLAEQLIPFARSEFMLAGLSADPGLAADRVVAHAVLSHLGHPDPDVDRLVNEARPSGPQFGPERVAFLRLEEAWLGRLWPPCATSVSERGLVGRSMLGRPMDTLGSTRIDVYAFTHAVMYASDFGARRARLPRARATIAAEADASLALSLDVDDCDLAAELAMTGPMLATTWSPTATFAFGLLAVAQDRWGFVPGPSFNAAVFEASSASERARIALADCYHTTFVMGMLCAASLRRGACPPRRVPSRGSVGAGDALMQLIERSEGEPRWRAEFSSLSARQQDALALLPLTTLLRSAKDRGDLAGVRTALEVALEHGLTDAPAVRQSVALLRRSAILAGIVGARNAAQV